MFSPHECSDDDKVTFLEDIELGDFESVKSFVLNKPNTREIYTERGESAVKFALLKNRLECYEILLSNGFELGPDEDLKEIIEELKRGRTLRRQRKLEEQILEIHFRCCKKLKPEHLRVLESITRISHNTPDGESQFYGKRIVKVFEALDEIEMIQPILKTVASSKVCEIILDVTCESVKNVDPAASDNVTGVTYADYDRIVVGARGLLNAKAEGEHFHDVLGTLAHELCHYAMHLVYKNERKPYLVGDYEREEEFNEVVKKCRENLNDEFVIRSVFDCYRPEKWHTELIVRVPHLLALYSDEFPDKLDEAQNNFSELFSFYENTTFVDLEAEYPKIEARLKVKELNDLCGVLAELKNSDISMTNESLETLNLEFSEINRILLFCSNSAQLTLVSIHQKLRACQNYESQNVFVKLQSLNNEKILQLVVEALKFCIQPTIIIDCRNQTRENVKMFWEKFQTNEKIIFVTEEISIFESDCENPSETCITHLWANLTIESQEVLMFNEVIFQGAKMPLAFVLENLTGI